MAFLLKYWKLFTNGPGVLIAAAAGVAILVTVIGFQASSIDKLKAQLAQKDAGCTAAMIGAASAANARATKNALDAIEASRRATQVRISAAESVALEARRKADLADEENRRLRGELNGIYLENATANEWGGTPIPFIIRSGLWDHQS